MPWQNPTGGPAPEIPHWRKLAARAANSQSRVGLKHSAGIAVSPHDLDLPSGRVGACPDLPIALLLVSQDSATPLREANVAAARLLGYEFSHELMLISLQELFVDAEILDGVESELRVHRGAIAARECQVLKKDGTRIWVSLQAKLERRAGAAESCDISLALLDLTETKRLREELIESEERFLAIFSNSAQGILLADPATRRLHTGNPRIAAMLGYSLEEISRLCVSDIHPPEALAEISTHFDRLARQELQFSRDVPVRRRDGTIFYADINIAYVRLNGKLFAAGFFHDITARKQAEEEAKGYEQRLRSLAIELSLAEERERRRLAGHLHDEVAQLLSLAQIRLTLLQPSIKDESCRKAASEMHALLGRALQSTRSLTFQMSHPALYDLGFIAAAEWLAEDVKKLYGIQVNISCDQNLKPLELRLRIVLFQCLRELLVNTVKHARVDTVWVRICNITTGVQVVVLDSGVGFDPNQLNENASGSGFGLFSIRERLRSLGGNVHLLSGMNQGTTATLEVPV